MASSAEGDRADALDPIEQFLQDQRYHGKSERTLTAYERVLRDFERYMIAREGDSYAIDAVHRETCMAWVHGLRDELKPSTIATYASYVNRFYRYMVDVGEFDGNPMNIVIEQMSESIESDPIRRDISLTQMRRFVRNISHPLDRAIVMTFLKTGMRVGELCNLDLRDVSLTGVALATELPAPRAGLDTRRDAFFVDNKPSRGDIVNGEERTASNKRQRATIIPIDAELRSVLRTWLAIRPDAISPADPLFVGTRDDWGERLRPEHVRYRVRNHAKNMGWHRDGGDAADNVTPHYFRHFFTTYLRDRTGDRGIVKYLRGDVADDVIETYTHNWGNRVRQRYEQSIYELL